MKLLYKYYLMIALPLVACLLVIGTGLSVQMSRYSISEKHAALELAARRVSAMTEDLIYSHSFSHEQMLKRVISSMSNDGIIHIVVCDSRGQIFLTSDPFGSPYMNATVSEKILSETANKEEFTGIGTLNGLYKGENYTVGIAARDTLENPVAYVYVTTSIENVKVLMNYVRNLFSFLALIVFILAAIVSYFIVRKMTRPLKQIASASKKFASGDFSARVPVQSTDEIGELTRTFNDMADSLEKSEELRRTFIANVSHELRSPMTSVTGFVDGILDGTIPEENAEHYLRIVSDEVHRLSRLVSRMLDLTVLQSRDITEQSTVFDFCELTRRVSGSFEKRLDEKELALILNLPPQSLSVLANEDSIYQVVYNLIDNAVKFSSDGKKIDVSVSERGSNILFSVRNYGNTIPASELSQIFDRFHKADRSRSRDKTGLGLGLYIAKTIINQHGGKIFAKSENHETEFSFFLPKKDQN